MLIYVWWIGLNGQVLPNLPLYFLLPTPISLSFITLLNLEISREFHWFRTGTLEWYHFTNDDTWHKVLRIIKIIENILKRRTLIIIWICVPGLSLARQEAAPSHSADHLPNTVFSCRDKVLGGYYADPDAQCQMFHVCVKVAGVGVSGMLFKYICPPVWEPSFLPHWKKNNSLTLEN